MGRIVVISSSPLLAEGVCAALRSVVGWDVRIGRATDDADAWVQLGDEIVVRGAQRRECANSRLIQALPGCALHSQRFSRGCRCARHRGSLVRPRMSR
jgi:hypothetical protein